MQKHDIEESTTEKKKKKGNYGAEATRWKINILYKASKSSCQRKYFLLQVKNLRTALNKKTYILKELYGKR